MGESLPWVAVCCPCSPPTGGGHLYPQRTAVVAVKDKRPAKAADGRAGLSLQALLCVGQ